MQRGLRPARLPTMAEVARRAGVSAMTVSRALKHPDMVSEEARARVHAAVRDTGYLLNDLAGGLKSAGRSKLVAAIFPSLRNSLFSETIQGLADQLQRSGLQLMVADSRRSMQVEESLVESLLAQRPSAIVLHDTMHTTRTRKVLSRAGIPVIETGDIVRRPIDSVVSFSNAAASRAMTSHLIARGYREIAFVSLDLAANVRAQHRLEGYRQALEEARLPQRPTLVITAEPGYASGAAVMRDLMKKKPRVDAVFFAGDVLATGALLECNRMGWTVPGRIAITSFDDYEIHAQLRPRLTAVEVPRYEIGRRTGELIATWLLDPKQQIPKRVDVGFRIAASESTAKSKADAGSADAGATSRTLPQQAHPPK